VAGAVVFGVLVDDVLPALVLAIGVEGAIAVRPPWPGAVRARVVVVAGLTVLAAVLAAGGQGADVAIFALALLALPAVGVADAAGRRNDQTAVNSTDVIERPGGSS
jgi:hypothetical protein